MCDRDPSLAQASLSELAHYRKVAEEAASATRALSDNLHPKLWDAIEALLDLKMQQHEASTDLFVAELVRHFPGMAPALTTVWHHVSSAFFETVGNCCTPPESADDGE